MELNEILVGDCLIKLKELEDNSIDSICTDPPYELGFMGKSWDNTGIANNPLMWAECLRVLKPGGYLLSFGGTRTYHRMACAIEDAGFEVRDMIEWVYGSGFPKSLNIGKAVDKLQGNEREVVDNPNTRDRTKHEATTIFTSQEVTGWDKTKGTSEWEGWGTALKPAHEPICMARKPLGQQELDIAKNICYNIIEKGFITNSKIIWRINNVKSAEKQKTKQSSTPTQQQKMVVVSAEFVETKENESVGKKIQKLIENICESTVKKTAKKQTKELQNTTEQIEKEYSNLIKPIKENEKRTQSKNMGVNVSAVEKQTLSSLPLTTLEVEEDSTEKKSKMETSMSSLKSTDTQKTDTDYSAQTATSQWVCMDIVRTLKVSFEGKEYDFIELSDGSLVWNENLEPYRKQQKLNVAENVLKYGTGGINIDESRVGTEGGGTHCNNRDENGKCLGHKNAGRSTSGETIHADLQGNNLYDKLCVCQENPTQLNANSVMQKESVNKPLSKSSAQENVATLGLENQLGTQQENTDKLDILCSEEISVESMNISLNTSGSGNERMEKSQRDMKSTTSTELNTTTDLKTCNVCGLPTTGASLTKGKSEVNTPEKQGRFPSNLLHDNSEEVRECFEDAQRRGCGRSDFARNTSTGGWSTGLKMKTGGLTNSYPGESGSPARFFKSIAYYPKSSKSERNKGCEGMPEKRPDERTETGMGTFEEKGVAKQSNFHPTVKPIALMEYLIKMVTPKGGIVLDPFAGSGSTLVAAKQNGFQYIGIEMTPEYIPIIEARLEGVKKENTLF